MYLRCLRTNLFSNSFKPTPCGNEEETPPADTVAFQSRVKCSNREEALGCSHAIKRDAGAHGRKLWGPKKVGCSIRAAQGVESLVALDHGDLR